MLVSHTMFKIVPRAINKLFNPLVAAIFMYSMPMVVIAAECSAKSGAATTPLLALYTSEGCSSCPPADKWLSELKLSDNKANKLVPLAFHVDYWDYIGWKDRFAKPEFSDRQRKAAAFNGSGFVYTPQFTFNGRDFRAWQGTRINQLLENSAQQPSRADLTLNISQLANGDASIKVNANVRQAEDAKHAEVYIAIYENKLLSQINAGENNGRALAHDYVVRELFGGYALNAGKSGAEFSKEISFQAGAKGRSLGAVVFVQNAANGEVLQTLQQPFCL